MQGDKKLIMRSKISTDYKCDKNCIQTISFMLPEKATAYQLLKDLNQPHILEALDQATPEQRNKLAEQLNHINESYPGGIKHYHEKALTLLNNSANDHNPYDDYDVGIPTGEKIHFNEHNLEHIEHYENLGMKELEKTVFVLVAGGLGERLGYPGIKIGIPFQLLSSKLFIQYYIEYILVFQNKYSTPGTKIPLIIMTSDDTNAQTIELLQTHQYFGMEKDQITILKQQKVPALLNNEAHFSLITKDDKFELETKPHGHGDIHTLLFLHGEVQAWDKAGKKWIVFFQDTNPLPFRSFPAFLGVTVEKDFEFNTMSINRKPGEALGAITTLIHKETKKSLTVNIEYNQLEALFKEHGGEPVDQEGFSKYPGNTNCFVIRADRYDEVLTRTKGQISEFINPKYADATKKKFKSSSRLECLMQDYPKLLKNCDRVGYTSIDTGFCFSTVKNDLASAIAKWKQGLKSESAGSCEADFYKSNRTMLRLCGANIEEEGAHQVSDMALPLCPMISISPKFAICLTEMRKKVKKLTVQKNSSLILGDDCILEDVHVDGHFEVKQITEQSISVEIKDKNYKQIASLTEEDPAYLQIRGYRIQ